MTWISHRDTVQLFRRCIEHPDYHFAVVYGVSDNDRNVWDNTKVAWLGYRPQDNAEDYAGEILSLMAPEDEPEIERTFHGGSFCDVEFSGDPSRID